MLAYKTRCVQQRTTTSSALWRVLRTSRCRWDASVPRASTARDAGLLLAVYHDLDDAHREHMKSRGVDPADYLGADDLGPLLGDDFTVELHAVEARIDPPPGTLHADDVVMRARRH